MAPTRRRLLAATTGLLAVPSLAFAQGATPAPIPAGDPRIAERSSGRADAKATVQEFFSLTCPHCAAFHRDTWPRVKSGLVETGKVRMVWRDFPLDQLALAAAVVARSLPPAQYEGFVSALFASQDRWAFARGADNVAEIAKVAAVAGMSRAQVDAALADQALQRAILEDRIKAQQEFNVSSTPTFVFNGRPTPGAISYDRFVELAGA